MADFCGKVRSVDVEMTLATIRPATTTLRIRPGLARFEIAPDRQSFVLPFSAEAEVPEHGGELVLRAKGLGGHLRVQLRADGVAKPSFRAQLVSGPRGRMSQRLVADPPDLFQTPQALPPGQYTVRVWGRRLAAQELGATIRAGERTELWADLVPR